MFDENELELLFSGVPVIDLHELRVSVQYTSWSETEDTIRWFWAAVESFNQEERARLLQFITGSSQLPLGGFAALHVPITIVKVRLTQAISSPPYSLLTSFSTEKRSRYLPTGLVLSLCSFDHMCPFPFLLMRCFSLLLPGFDLL